MGILDAFLRVFSDGYRLHENYDPWADPGNTNQTRKPWNEATDIGKNHRVRQFAQKLWPQSELDQRLNEVLQALKAIGHANGLISVPNVRLRLVELQTRELGAASIAGVSIYITARVTAPAVTSLYPRTPTSPLRNCGTVTISPNGSNATMSRSGCVARN